MNKMLNEMLSHNQESLKIGFEVLARCVSNLDSDGDFAYNFMMLENILRISKEQIQLMKNIYGMKEVEI